MKKLLLATILISAPAMATELEKNAFLSKGIQPGQAIAAAKFVQLHGYRCDSIRSFSQLQMSHGFRLACNGARYTYELRDVGGRWQVTVK
jgi:hypothetical protein